MYIRGKLSSYTLIPSTITNIFHHSRTRVKQKNSSLYFHFYTCQIRISLICFYLEWDILRHRNIRSPKTNFIHNLICWSNFFKNSLTRIYPMESFRIKFLAQYLFFSPSCFYFIHFHIKNEKGIFTICGND